MSWIGLPILFALPVLHAGDATDTTVLVERGVNRLVRITAGVHATSDALSLTDSTSRVIAIPSVEEGDVTVEARLRIADTGGVGAYFLIHRSRFAFGGPNGPWFQDLDRSPITTRTPIEVPRGRWFDFRLERRGDRLAFYVDGRLVLDAPNRRAQLGELAFVAGDARLDVAEWRVTGDVSWPSGLVEESAPFEVSVYVDGDAGARLCRIPAVAVAGGTLLAACEGRRSPEDDADTDVLIRRSTDLGETWTDPERVVADDGSENVTLGNPTFVVDVEAGITFLFACRDNTRILVVESHDDGMTWGGPRDVTDQVSRPGWVWVGTGPGAGIQLTQSAARGRLIVPASHQGGGTHDDRKGDLRRTHVLMSDDHGQSWSAGETVSARTSEAAVAELGNGTLVLNMRNHLAVGRRRVARSTDGGLTWAASADDPHLPDPECHGSLIRWPASPVDGAPVSLVFANLSSHRVRERLVVRVSDDGGETWPVQKLLHDAAAGYTSLTVLPNGDIGLLYEEGSVSQGASIRFARFSMEWLRAPFADRR